MFLLALQHWYVTVWIKPLNCSTFLIQSGIVFFLKQEEFLDDCEKQQCLPLKHLKTGNLFLYHIFLCILYGISVILMHA